MWWVIAVLSSIAFAGHLQALARRREPPVWGGAIGSFGLTVFCVLAAMDRLGATAIAVLLVAAMANAWQAYVLLDWRRRKDAVVK